MERQARRHRLPGLSEGRLNALSADVRNYLMALLGKEQFEQVFENRPFDFIDGLSCSPSCTPRSRRAAWTPRSRPRSASTCPTWTGTTPKHRAMEPNIPARTGAVAVPVGNACVPLNTSHRTGIQAMRLADDPFVGDEEKARALLFL